MRLPIGERESLSLEFKSREVSKEKVSREVVGMLNAAGGVVWIGIGEEAGVAQRVEPLADAEATRIALRDHFIEMIEPQPSPDAIEIEPVATGSGAVLAIHVERGDARPYAQLVPPNGRAYLVRVSDRLRRMTREELVEAFRAAGAEEADDGFEKLLRERVDASTGLHVLVRPRPSASLPVAQRGAFDAYFRDPRLTGNREAGWNFLVDEPPRRAGRSVRFGGDGPAQTELREDGTLVFRVELESLQHAGTAKTIWPLALVEFPTSFLRLAARIYRDANLPEHARVQCGVGLSGAEGWTLRPGSPRSFRYERQAANELASGDFVEHVAVPWAEMRENPDSCALKLVKLAYAAFGYFDDAVPPEFDRVSGRLTFPS